MAAGEFSPPFPVTFKGSSLARSLFSLMGWKVYFDGLPCRQGIAIIYPHTSNWDFLTLVLAKWSAGVAVRFWAKDSLFQIPLFGRWLRWLGGVPVKRTLAQGVVTQTAQALLQAKRDDDYFWLALAPEGTRKHIPGWRSGFYRTALMADVPLCLVQLDYQRKAVSVSEFIRLTGDEHSDMLRIAAAYEGVVGYHPTNQAPIHLLDASVARSETINK